MMFAHIRQENSLRDIDIALNAQASKLYHIGIQQCPRTTLADANERRDYPLVEWRQGDILLPESLEGVANGMDVVLHLAAAGHVAAVSPEAERAFMDLNVNGTKSLLAACEGVGLRRFVHFSSTAAMGLIKAETIDESTLCNPKSPYQKSKYESERAALETGLQLGIDVLVLRPCMVYGPGGKGEFHKFYRLIRKGVFPRVGLGENRTPIVHVADVVQAATKALTAGRAGEIYLIASDGSPPFQEIHRAITDALGARRPYFYIPLWLAYSAAMLLEMVARIQGNPPLVSRKNIISMATGRVFDISKARKELGYRPDRVLREGVKETVQWLGK